ncbi:hypothetical protein DM02DRAFT_601692 [Periconia macrospinosa]|uniref:AAA+ ATPase domain-containing protein n=1 Tax=Periconia macrospinosa TaxID=97972 RepID=A0A2V1DA24_9PLEO|nr:hypothetical protein DM02DRAFT_601692 [Periconia macrospinosa]
MHRPVDPWIQRIRVNSRSVMQFLGSCSPKDNNWGGEPRTFVKPFHYLVRCHDTVKNRVEKLEQKIENSQEGAARDVTEDSQDAHAPGGELHEFSTWESLDELRCYIKFMDEEVLPIINRFAHPDLSKPQTVHFHELDYLFPIGCYIYMNQRDTDLTPIQRIKRVCWTVSSSSDCLCPDWECQHRWGDWGMSSYYLDHDGEKYGCVIEQFVCTSFPGEMDIRSLLFFPVQFLPDHGVGGLDLAKNDGAKFVEHISKGYSFYSGWSLTKGPDGTQISDPKSLDPMKNPEHIESDVIVDLAEAFDFCPSWRPGLGLLWQTSPAPPFGLGGREKEDTLTVIDWTDEKRTSRRNVWTEIIVADLWVQLEAYETFIMAGDYVGRVGGSVPLCGDELALLPRRMFGYAVWDRKFFPIDSRFLNSSSKNGEEDEAFDQLQILPEKKTIITALVQSHFSRKQLEQKGIEVPSQDLIRGKGRGIVILLHGLPGVGKTATAEAVAQKWKKPLFPITCGDLGFTPEKVEQSLKEIFRLAHLWDCVLLLDEADVFIAQRAKHGTDLQRNALVSVVFLRMLEYYNGVLFLTTNRVGVLDEAIKSRVHLHLKYDRLNRDQTLEIFKHNIQRLREIEKKKSEASSRITIVDSDILEFARKQYDRNHSHDGMGMWNGRQIRNAFLIAAAIAHHEGDRDRESNPTLQKQLRASHFEKVDKATLDYDRDRADVLQATDSDLAYDRQERFDGPLRRESSFPPQQQYQVHQQPIASYSSPPNTFYGASQAPYQTQQPPQQMYAVPAQSYGGPRNEPGADTPYLNNPPQGYTSGNPQASGSRLSGLP